MDEALTLQSVDVRAVVLPLRRPIVSKVGEFRDWPMILIDLYTREGVIGRNYLEPYLKDAMRPIAQVIQILSAAYNGKRLAPLDAFQSNRRSLNLVGYEGISMIAAAGFDMAILPSN